MKYSLIKQSKPKSKSKEIPIARVSYEVSPQLNMLINQLKITNMRDLIDPEITNDELDKLLHMIMIESRGKQSLMDIVQLVAEDKKIKKQKELTNLKVTVLLDNLANKICKCRNVENVENDDKKNMEPICRSNIFQKRDIDFITYDCGAAPKNKSKYNYGVGPLLRPAIRSKSKVVLRRYRKSIK